MDGAPLVTTGRSLPSDKPGIMKSKNIQPFTVKGTKSKLKLNKITNNIKFHFVKFCKNK